MTANDNRRLKGIAINKLKELGFNDLYCSDSGSNIVIVTGNKDEIVKLLKIVSGSIAYRRFDNKIDCYITIGKINIKKLGIESEA
jgi:hypothetical protein